ncbi:hypothetical protein POM88_051963 [Heracleum sosnowskyi]|uniref:Uncharacterized protein n=1 Tax=Heracleum sosnowskyi TaxID=360622 RepID=A0AAD8LYX5_9APIA|nr:hypothetical protein POM88_051963 [Heracleum sosnowskyi]
MAFQLKSHEHCCGTQRFVVTQGLSWDEVSKNVSEIVLRVNLVTAVRFKHSWRKSKKHALLVQKDVQKRIGNKHEEKMDILRLFLDSFLSGLAKGDACKRISGGGLSK